MIDDNQQFSNLINDCLRRIGMPASGYHCDTRLVFPATNELPAARILKLLTNGKETLVFHELAGYANRDNIQYIKSGLGFKLYYHSLEPLLGHEAGIFVFSEFDDECLRVIADSGLVQTCKKPIKKQVRRHLRSLRPWSHPYKESEIQSALTKVRDLVARQYEQWRSQSFYETLDQYSDFVESFSHESLSPLQQVKNTLARVRSQLGQQHPSQINELESAEWAVDRIRVSLSGMRLLFKGDDKPLDNQYRDVNLHDIVQAWLKFFHPQIDEKNLQVIVEPQNSSWSHRVVKEYIEVMIKNLIDNAVKYSFTTSGAGNEGKIVIRWDYDNRRLSVISFGVPIPKEEIEDGSLFSISQRGSTSSDRGRMGRGVGMHLIKRIANLHDAEIHVKSEIMNPDSFGKEKFARNEIAVSFSDQRKQQSKRIRGPGKGVVGKRR